MCSWAELEREGEKMDSKWGILSSGLWHRIMLVLTRDRTWGRSRRKVWWQIHTHTHKKPSAHDNISDPGNDLHITIFFCPSIDSSVVAGTEPQRELIETDAVSDSRSVYALKYIYIFLSVCLKCVRAESVLQSKLLPFSSLCHRGCHVDHHGLSKHELVCK